LRPIVASLLLVGLLVPATFAQEKQTKRDWDKHPAILQAETTQDVFALGDVHGDYERLVSLLVSAKIIAQDPGAPEKAQWQAGKAMLVCTGDFIDKGNQSLQVIALLRTLQTSAQSQGGRVIVTMGNHEAEFLADPGNKKAQKFLQEMEAKKIDAKAVAAGQDAEGIGRFLRSLPLAARVNDWFFAHAGFTRGRTLKQLDAELRDEVDSRGYDALQLPALNALLEARLHETPWFEKADDTPAMSKTRLQGFVEALGAKHLVIGHQPGKAVFAGPTKRAKGEMFQLHDGLLFLIDVGMSHGIDKMGQGYSEGALLHIRPGPQGSATAIFPRQQARVLWTEKKQKFPGERGALAP